MFGFFKKKSQVPENLWHQFEGRGNSDEVLREKAKLFAHVLIDWVQEGTRNLVERVYKDSPIAKPENIFGQVFFETIIFCLHYTDRIAFGLLETQQRDIFMNALVAQTEELLLEAQPDEKSKQNTRTLFSVLYSANQEEYQKYKLVAGKDEGFKGTLFWEFEAKIARMLGFDKDMIVVMDVHINVSTLLTHLQIQNLLEK